MNTKQAQYEESIAQKVIREYEQLSGNRGGFEQQWIEIAQRVYPSSNQQFNGNGIPPTQGDKRTRELLDSTAVIALNRFAAIMDSLLTPQNKTWHKLKVNNHVLAKNRQVQLYFEEATATLFRYRYAPKANFVSQNQKNFKSLGSYGTGGLFIDDLYGGYGLRYKNIHIGKLFIDENHQGLIDKAIRSFFMSARQAKQMWGENLPDSIKSAAERDGNKQFQFLHYVAPRTDDFDPNRKDHKGMPFVSYYVSMEGKKFLREKGYSSFPYAISRYEQADDEVYGRSPAMEVLPAIKTLNEEKRILLKQGHKALDPTLLTADDGIINGFSLAPGAINAGGVSADGRVLVHALPVGNVAVGKELMDDERAVINDGFLVSLFQILMETPQMSATEVLERAKEKGILLAPTMGRQNSEYLGPMIERELDVLTSQGLLPPMPQVLIEAKGEYKIEYDSPLTRAARAEEAAGFMRSLETALQIVNVTQDPSLLDFYNFEEIIPDISDIQGMPARWMRGMEQIQAIREGRSQQAQIQQMIQAGPSIAAVTKAGAALQKGSA